MIKIGDKVKFLNDVGGGVVTGFAGKNVVYVKNQDGFEIPCPVSELLKTDDPYLNKGAENLSPKSTHEAKPVSREIIQQKGEMINGKNNPDFYFCFVPVSPVNAQAREMELYLVNDSNFTLLYRYSHILPLATKSVKFGTLVSNSRVLLETLLPEKWNDLPEFGFQIVYFRNEESEWNDPFVKKFKINPLKFYRETTFQQNSLFKTNALVLQIAPHILNAELDKLTTDDFRKIVEEKSVPEPEKPEPRKRNPELVEIDLHINELVDSSTGLSNAEILDIQKEKVELEMKLAIQKGVKRIVFIHGVGQGVLKQEVINLLKKKFGKYNFQDASFKEYGFGATMVILRKGK